MHYAVKSTDEITEICSIIMLFCIKLSSYITIIDPNCLLRMTDISSGIATQINSFFRSLTINFLVLSIRIYLQPQSLAWAHTLWLPSTKEPIIEFHHTIWVIPLHSVINYINTFSNSLSYIFQLEIILTF